MLQVLRRFEHMPSFQVQGGATVAQLAEIALEQEYASATPATVSLPSTGMLQMRTYIRALAWLSTAMRFSSAAECHACLDRGSLIWLR